MKCALCGGNLSEKYVNEEVIEGNTHVVVKVKAEVCENCHERYYASGIVDNLINIKDGIKRNKLKLHVLGKVCELKK